MDKFENGEGCLSISSETAAIYLFYWGTAIHRTEVIPANIPTYLYLVPGAATSSPLVQVPHKMIPNGVDFEVCDGGLGM